MTEEHSPLPFIIHDGNIFDCHGVPVATLFNDWCGGDGSLKSDLERRDANASLIVAAVNSCRSLSESHAELLSAAKAVVPIMTELMQRIPSTGQGYEAKYKCLGALNVAIFNARDIVP